MMDGFSPLSRRVIALGLLILACLSLVSFVIQPLVNFNLTAIGRLQDARFQLARLQAQQQAPAAQLGQPVPPDMLLGGRVREDAVGQLLSTLDETAQATNATLEAASPLPEGSRRQEVAADIVVAGEETALSQFVQQLESANPIIRLTSWRMAAPDAPNAPTRLEGRTTAIWRGRP